MNTSGQTDPLVTISPELKEALTVSLGTLGRFHNGSFVISRHCMESLKNIIRFLRRDSKTHTVRRFLGDIKLIQNELINIVKSCPADSDELLHMTVRLLTVLTTPVTILYDDQYPAERTHRRVYTIILGHLQSYKEAFDDIDFWKVICRMLTKLFEIKWSHRSESQCLEIEKLLIFTRNVLDVPPDANHLALDDTEITLHERILWNLRLSLIFEFLLYVSLTKSEHRYYLHLLEIIFLMLRQQDPKVLATSDINEKTSEMEKELKELIEIREREKSRKIDYHNTRRFESTFYYEGLQAPSGAQLLFHGFIEDVKRMLQPSHRTEPMARRRRRALNLTPGSEHVERRSHFAVRIFLKEFCAEFLNCSYNNLMSVVSEKLLSGKGLPNDEIFYFWALKFFLDFNSSYKMDIKLVSNSVTIKTFHFLQTNMHENFEKLVTDKKGKVLWAKKLRAIVEAFHGLMWTLRWMNMSKDKTVQDMSLLLSSQVFYVPEYREMPLAFLKKYDSNLFSMGYLRYAVEASHIFMKLLEEYAKENKIVVRKTIRQLASTRKRTKYPTSSREYYMEKWEQIRDELFDKLWENRDVPDLPPFDPLQNLGFEGSKLMALRKIQKFLHEEKLMEAIGLLRSARKEWPRDFRFANKYTFIDWEMLTLESICIDPELGNEIEDQSDEKKENDKKNSDEDSSIYEEYFDVTSYKKQLLSRRVVEACAVLLSNYQKNSDYTNLCVVKILVRIGWDCSMPAMLFQTSLFSSFVNILQEKLPRYNELKRVAVRVFKKFLDHLKEKNMFMETFFYKNATTAFKLQESSEASAAEDEKAKTDWKTASWTIEEEGEVYRLWQSCSPEYDLKKKIEWIKMNLTNQSRPLRQVKNVLQEWGLCSFGTHFLKDSEGREWLAEEEEELWRLFTMCSHGTDVAKFIAGRFSTGRPRKSIRKKLLQLNFVTSIAEFKTAKKQEGQVWFNNAEAFDSDYFESSDDEQIAFECCDEDRRDALRKVQHMKTALQWLKDKIEESIEKEDEEAESYPLIAVEEIEKQALENDYFIVLLRRLGLKEPIPDDPSWKIPKDKSKMEHMMNLLTSAINGELPKEEEEDDSEVELQKLRQMLWGPRDETANELSSPSIGRGTRVRRKTKAPIAESDDSVKFVESVPGPSSIVITDSSDSEITCLEVRPLNPHKESSDINREKASGTLTEGVDTNLDDEDDYIGRKKTKSMVARTGGVLDEDSDEEPNPPLKERRPYYTSYSDSDSEDEKLKVTFSHTKKTMKVIDSDSD